jgi:hypothetical protein
MRFLFVLAFLSISFFITQQAFAQCNGAPTVDDTETIASVTTTTATLGSDVTNDGAGTCTVSARGIKWSTVSAADAITNGTQVAAATGGEGAYTVAVTGLPAGTQIFFVGYATNSNSTGYSNGASFYTTATEPGAAGALTATTQDEDVINLSFGAASGLSPAGSGYIIYRNSGSLPTVGAVDRAAAPTSGDYETNISSAATTGYSVSGLSSATRYFFTIVPYAWNSNSATSYNFNTTGVSSANAWTLSNPPDNQPNAALTASATSPTNIDLGFLPLSADGVANENGFLILRTTGGNPNVNLVQDGVAPSSQTNFVANITNTATISFSDNTVSPNTQYYYVIIPYNWDTTNPETYNYRITDGVNPVRYANATTPTTTVTLTGFNTGGSNGLSTTFLGGTNNNAIIGFSINSTNGPATLTSVGVRITTGDPAGVYSDFELFKSTDNTFDGGDASMGTATPTGVGPYTLTFPVSQAMATNTAQYYFLIADLPTSANPASNHVFAIANTDITVTNGTVGASSFTRDITVTRLEADFTQNTDTDAAIGDQDDIELIDVTVNSNGTQAIVDPIVFKFDVDVTNILENFELRVDGAALMGGPVTYDLTNGGKTLTVNVFNNEDVTDATNLTLIADVKANVTSANDFTASLTNTDVAVDLGFVESFGTFSNAVNITASEIEFTQNADAASAVGDDTNVILLNFTANSNGSQSIISPLVVTFNTSVASVLENFELTAGGSALTGAPDYSLDGLGTTLTISGFDPINVTNDVIFSLIADVKIAVTSGDDFTITLVPGGVTTDFGTIENFTSFTNSVDIFALEAEFTQNADTDAAIGDQDDIELIDVTVNSNGTQAIIDPIVFKFDVDVTNILENFELKVDGAALTGGPVTYNLTDGGKTLTVNVFNDEDVTSATAFILIADVKANVSSANDFTASLTNTDVSIDRGVVEAFGTFSNAVNITASEIDFSQNADDAVAIGDQDNVVLLNFDADSDGSQSIVAPVVVTFNTSVAAILENFELTAGGGALTGTPDYQLDMAGTTLTISGFNPINVTNSTTFSLMADIKSTATSANDFTITIVPAGVAADFGSIQDFTSFTNSVDVSALEAGFAQNTDTDAAIGDQDDIELLDFTVNSNGTQAIVDPIVFKFNVDVTNILENFELKVDGLALTGGPVTYDLTDAGKTLTVNVFNNEDVTNATNFILYADVKANVTSANDFTASLTNTDVAVDLGYVQAFGTFSNAVDITASDIAFNQNADDGAAVGGQSNVILLNFDANSNGSQSIVSPLVVTFNTSVAAILENFELTAGGSALTGTPDYQLDMAGTTLTISGFNAINVTNATTFSLMADIKSTVLSANDFIITLVPAGVASDFGTIANFTSFTNSVDITILEAAFAQNADTDAAIGDQDDIEVLDFTVNSNGTQAIVDPIVFKFDVDVTNILENFELKVDGAALTGGPVTYTLTNGGKTLTVDVFNNEDVTNATNFILFADVVATVGSANDFVASLTNTDVAVDRGFVEAFGTFSNAVDVTGSDITFTQNGDDGAVTGGQDNVILLNFDANSNGSQSIVSPLVLTFNTSVLAILENFELTAGGSALTGIVDYSLDGPGTTLTISGFDPVNVTNATTFSLMADIKSTATSGDDFNITLLSGGVAFNFGSIIDFVSFTNSIDVTALEAAFTQNADTDAAIGDQDDIELLDFSVNSNGVQSIIDPIVFKFDVDVTNILENFELRVDGGALTGGPVTYNLTNGGKTLTINVFNDEDVTNATNFILFADVKADVTSANDFTASLTSTDVLVNEGLITAFGPFSNAVNITASEIDFTQNADDGTALGNEDDVVLLNFDANSNGSQSIISPLVVTFNTSVTAILENFELTAGGSALTGTPNYLLDVTGTTLTISGFNPVSVTNATAFSLMADIKSTATSANDFTVTLAAAGVTANFGTIEAFGTFTNTVDVTALEADFTQNVDDGSALGNQDDITLLAFSANSNGIQNLISPLSFTFNTNVSGVLENIEFLVAGAPVAATIGLDGPGTTLTVSAFANVDITNATTFAIRADIKSTALSTNDFTITLANTGPTVDLGYVESFVAFTNDVDVTALEADFTQAADDGSLVGGQADRTLMAFSVNSNGVQNLISPLVFTFNTSVANILEGFELRVDGAPVAATHTLDGAGTQLTVTAFANVDVTNATNFELRADVKTTVFSADDFTISLASTGATVDLGYPESFVTFTNVVDVTILQANLAPAPGEVTTAVGGNLARKILSFTGTTTAGGTQTIDKLIFDFDVDVASQLTGFALKNGAGTTVGTASYSAGTKKLTVSSIGEDISTTESFDLFADVLDTAPSGAFVVSLLNADNPTTNSAFTVDRGYVGTIGAPINNTVTITGLTATIAQVTGGAVLVASSTLEAGTSNRPLYAFKISSNGVQTLTDVTFHFLNQPNGLTNFRLFKGTSGDVGAQVATAADPGGNSITFTLSEALPPTLSDDYYYLVANVLGTANISNANDITISLDPTTSDITVSPGTKSATAFVGASYIFRSSAQTAFANNEGETSPINFAIYSTKVATAGLTTGNAQKVYSFTISGADNDTQATNITQITFNVAKSENIAALALLNASAGNANFAEVAVTGSGTQAINFGNGSSTILSVADNGNITIDVYATFRSSVIDNDEIIFQFMSASTDGVASGIISSQGTFTSDVGENNITVLATEMRVQTLSVLDAVITKINPNQNFKVRAQATDANGNIDKDKTSTADFDALNPNPSTETVSPSASNQSWSAGQVEWTVALAPADLYDLEVHDDGGLTDVTIIDFQVESLGSSVTVADLEACVVGSSSIYSTLPDIVLVESDQGDFAAGSGLTFLLVLPAGWEFQTSGAGYTNPSMNFVASQNVTTSAFTSFIGKSIVKFTYSVSGTNKVDQITITGLKVKNVSATGPGDIFRTGTGVMIGVDDSEVLGTLDLPATQPIATFEVEALPGSPAVNPTETRFSINNDKVILNGTIDGVPVSETEAVFTGNGIGFQAIGAPVNDNRYVFDPKAVIIGNVNINVVITSANTGCQYTKTRTFEVYNLAITGLSAEYCNNDSSPDNLSVSTDLPANSTFYDFVYYDYNLAGAQQDITNNAVPANSEIIFYNAGVPKGLTQDQNFIPTQIIFDPTGARITNPAPGVFGSAPTSFVELTIPNHTFVVGDLVYIQWYIYQISPFYIGYQYYTVIATGTNGSDTYIRINVAEPYGYPPFVNYGSITWNLYAQYSNPSQLTVSKASDQVFSNTYIDFKIPNHTFVDGDVIIPQGMYYVYANVGGGLYQFAGNRFTVEYRDANTIRIDVAERFPGATHLQGRWYGEQFWINLDPYVPLPGYIFDTNKAFPHKGAARSTATNNQFRADGFLTNWPYSNVYVIDRFTDNGCPACDPFTYHWVNVNLTAPPSVDFSGLASSYCNVAPGSPITLTGNQLDGTFTISGGIGLTDGGVNNPTATFNPVAPSIAQNTPLTVTYTFTSGCTGTAQKTVTVRSLPVVDAGDDADLCVGNSIILGDATAVATGNGPFSYSWNNSADLDNAGLSNPKATPTVNKTYTVTVTDAFNCTNNDAITITTFTPILVNAIAPNAICGSDIANGIDIGTSSIVGTSVGTWSTPDDPANPPTNPSTLGVFRAGATDDAAYGSTDKFFPIANSGFVKLRLTSEDPAGPCPAASDEVIVNINPSAVVSAGGPYEYCATSTNMQVNGVVTLDGAPYTNVLWTENGANVMANPSLAVTSYVPTAGELANGATISLTLTALDSDGTGPCLDVDQNVSLVIAPRPIANAGPDMTICASTVPEYGASVTLSGSTTLPGGSITGSWSGGTGSFAGSGTTPVSAYTPNASTLTMTAPLTETLTLTTDDPASVCGPESDQMTVTTYHIPPAPIAPQPAQVCVGVAVPSLTAQGSGLTWYTQIDPSKTHTYAPSGFAGVGSPINTGLTSTTDLVKDYYVIQSANGCPSPPTTVTVVINPLPTPDFDIDNFCLGDYTAFTDLSSLTYNNGRSGSITNWSWDMKLDDITLSGLGTATINRTGSRGTYQNPEHIFSAPGSYDVELTVSTSDGCSNSVLASASTFGKQLEIGVLPKANFTFSAICSGDDTQFTYLDTENPADNRTVGFSWNFGDASPALTIEDPTHEFPTNGTYNVSLTLTTDLECQASVTKSVFILPYVTDLTNGYFQNFEAYASTGWIHEGLAADFQNNSLIHDSWQILDLTSTSIGQNTNGQYAFVTSAVNQSLPSSRIYGTNERSVLYPPCVDLTTLPRPALSFDYWRDMDDKDGVYLEVSTDNGASWQRLGNGLDPNWYTNASISGLSAQPDRVYSSAAQPKSIGQPIDQFGFTGSPTEPLLADQWKSAKFSLDGYATQSKLRLRFVFGSNGDISDKMGFVMDNFKLGSRNRKVLVENFTNSAQSSNNANFNVFKAGLINTEVVKLQYHSSLLGEDDNNLMNPIDLNARAAFYGLTNQTNVIPRAFIDGKSLAEGYFTADPTPWAENLFSSQALSVAPLAITLNTVDGADEELKTTVSITSNEVISTGKPVLIVAVVEKVVGSDRYVVRKLLPSASGYPLPMPINQGVTITTPLDLFSWFVDMEGIDVTQLAVVAFVQDLESKNVLQAEVDFNPLNLPKAVTGIGEIDADEQFKVYPNPADKELIIELPQVAQTRTEMQMFDQMGKRVEQSFFEKGVRNKTITTSGLAGGVYFIQVNSPNGLLMKKVVITHSH